MLAEHLEAMREGDLVANELRAVEQALTAITTQQTNYVPNLGMVRGALSALVAAKLDEPGREAVRLEAEHADAGESGGLAERATDS